LVTTMLQTMQYSGIRLKAGLSSQGARIHIMRWLISCIGVFLFPASLLASPIPPMRSTEGCVILYPYDKYNPDNPPNLSPECRVWHGYYTNAKAEFCKWKVLPAARPQFVTAFFCPEDVQERPPPKRSYIFYETMRSSLTQK
jgi:hypothetical protein